MKCYRWGYSSPVYTPNELLILIQQDGVQFYMRAFRAFRSIIHLKKGKAALTEGKEISTPSSPVDPTRRHVIRYPEEESLSVHIEDIQKKSNIFPICKPARPPLRSPAYAVVTPIHQLSFLERRTFSFDRERRPAEEARCQC